MARRMDLDVLRGIAIIAVILIHVTGGNYEGFVKKDVLFFSVFTIIHYLASFAVPLFIFISGISLSTHYNENYSLKEFYLRRFKSIVPQYLIFSVIYILVFRWDNLPGIREFVNMIVFSTSAHYHLWFFTLIFQIYLFYPVVIFVYSKIEKTRYLNLVMPLLFIVQMSAWVIMPINDLVLFRYLFYFVMGIYLGRNLNRFNIPESVLLISSLMFCLLLSGLKFYPSVKYGSVTTLYVELIWFSQHFYHVPIIIFLYRKSSVWVNGKFLRILSTVGKSSFGMFLIHALILDLSTMLLVGLGISRSSVIFYFLISFITIIFSYWSVKIVKQLPCGNYIVGK